MTKKVLFQSILFLYVFCGCELHSSNPKIKNVSVTDSALISTPKKKLGNNDRASNKTEYSLTKVSKSDFEFAKNIYRSFLVTDTLKFRKANGKLILPLYRKQPTNSVISFTDVVSQYDDGHEEYNYLGQYPKIGFYIVEGEFWEHQECYLINKKTGEKVTTWGFPLLSKSNKYLANLSMSYGLEGIPNGIQVWRINFKSKKIETDVLEIDQQIWAPLDFTWTQNDDIMLKVYSIEKFWEKNGEINENDHYYLKLSFE